MCRVPPAIAIQLRESSVKIRRYLRDLADAVAVVREALWLAPLETQFEFELDFRARKGISLGAQSRRRSRVVSSVQSPCTRKGTPGVQRLNAAQRQERRAAVRCE